MSEYPDNSGNFIPPVEAPRLYGDDVARCQAAATELIKRALPDPSMEQDPKHERVQALFGKDELFLVNHWEPKEDPDPVISATRYNIHWGKATDDIKTLLQLVFPPGNEPPYATGQLIQVNTLENRFVITGSHLESATQEAIDKLKACRPVTPDKIAELKQDCAISNIRGAEARSVWGSVELAVSHLLEMADPVFEFESGGNLSNRAEPDIIDRASGLPIRQVVVEQENVNHAGTSVYVSFDECPSFIPSELQFIPNGCFEVTIHRAEADPQEIYVAYAMVFPPIFPVRLVEELLPGKRTVCLTPDQRKQIHNAITRQLAVSNLQNHIGWFRGEET